MGRIDDRLADIERAAEAQRRRNRDAEYARAQANAKESIPATGRHHRKDGK
jgi:hypothetical protein